MIDIQELRIGNNVSYGNKPVKIIGILNELNIKILVEQEEIITVEISKLKPILTTSVILEKYGFELFTNDNPDPSDWYWVKRGFPFAIWNKSFILQKLNIEIQSLHQLQNLYFDFTGKELVKNK